MGNGKLNGGTSKPAEDKAVVVPTDADLAAELLKLKQTKKEDVTGKSERGLLLYLVDRQEQVNENLITNANIVKMYATRTDTRLCRLEDRVAIVEDEIKALKNQRTGFIAALSLFGAMIIAGIGFAWNWITDNISALWDVFRK